MGGSSGEGLLLFSFKKSPPRPLETKSHHSIEDEIQKLVTKGAVKKVFLSRAIPQTDFTGPLKQMGQQDW